MHTPRLPAAHMMPSVGALMDPIFLRGAVADATEPAHAATSSAPSSIAAAWAQGLAWLARLIAAR